MTGLTMFDVLQYEFMRNALLAGILTTIVCGIIGSLVIVNRLVFITGGLSHAAYGGIGLAIFLGFSPLLGALGFAIIVSALLAWLTFHDRHRSDTVIGLLWAAGMALGIILIDLTPGYNIDLMSYLFGSILLISQQDISAMIILTMFVGLSVFFLYPQFLALSYDTEFAHIRGIPVKILYTFLLVMVAISVVMIIRLVGLILVIAFMTIAPFIAEKFAKSLGSMMLYSFLLNLLFTVTGLMISYKCNLTAGATIILCASAFFVVFLTARKCLKNYKKGSFVER